MIDLSRFDGKDLVFVGVGKGRSFEGFQDFMRRHAAAGRITGVDKQPNSAAPLDFLKDYDLERTVFVKNEGVPGREMPVPYISPTQLFFECIDGRGATIIGITGTKGKTTTTSMVGAILRAAGKNVIVAGNIGTSVLHYVNEVTAETTLVLELSSHQLSDLTYSPHIAAVTNLYEDHLDYYGSLAAYWEAKHAITKYQTADDYFIYNPGFPTLADWAQTTAAHAVPLDASETLPLEHFRLIGEHNHLNALMARTIARLQGVDDAVTHRALEAFEPVPHRLQPVATVGGHTFIDDAIASQPEAAIAGIAAVTRSVGPIGCLLLGGQDRGYNFDALMQAVAAANIPHLVLFPDSAARMRQALPAAYQPQILETSSMEEAVQWAAAHAPQGTVILLCNGAPSYSLWKDFEEKGDQFQNAIKNL